MIFLLTILLFGDSNTDNGYRGSRLVAQASVNTAHDPSQLSGMLERRGMHVVSRAAGGSTSRMVLDRFSTDADYVYVSIGTNDCRYGGTYTETVVNLRAMVRLWRNKHPSRHFIVTTIPPTPDHPECRTDIANRRIRQVAKEEGLTLVDLSGFVSRDDGLTWKNPAFSIHPPSDVHYTTPVRHWIAEQIARAVSQ